MNNEIVESFSQMVREKGMDKDQLAIIIEEIFGIMVKKKYGPDARFSVVVNMDRGDIEIFLERTIVDVVENPSKEISIDEVNERGNEDELEVGDDYTEKLSLESFGRRLVSVARQSLSQKVRDIEKETVYRTYIEQVGDIIVGDIYQVRKNDVLINHNKNELVLPRSEQIPKEKYRKGETLRAVITNVSRPKNGPPVITISRTSNLFLQRLFEIEIPEIYDGIIQIVKIVREPGERAKVAVTSKDPRIDAVGACVGMKGVRIHAIVRELNNENIDVINYSPDPVTFIQRALSPAKLKEIEIDEESKRCKISAASDQIPTIVGRNGVNIRLANRLTGFEIEVLREEKTFDEYEDDIELVELRQELGTEIVDFLINNRFDTAVEVLSAGIDELMSLEGMTKEKAEFIIDTIKNQFEEEE